MKKFGPDVPCVVCGKPVRRTYERHRYCSLACWEADPANAEHAILKKPAPWGKQP